MDGRSCGRTQFFGKGSLDITAMVLARQNVRRGRWMQYVYTHARSPHDCAEQLLAAPEIYIDRILLSASRCKNTFRRRLVRAQTDGWSDERADGRGRMGGRTDG